MPTGPSSGSWGSSGLSPSILAPSEEFNEFSDRMATAHHGELALRPLYLARLRRYVSACMDEALSPMPLFKTPLPWLQIL